VDTWKDAIFMFESAQVPPELKIVDQIAENFRATPESQMVLVQVCHSLDEAAVTIDSFKARTCGSAYTMAVINLNMFGTREEFNFMMQPSVLGDPRTIYLASLKSMAGEGYTYAKNKVNRESDTQFGAPSCIDCYGASNRDETAARLSTLLVAYLQEEAERLQAKRSGTQILLDSEALRQLKSSTSIYFGNRGRVSGFYRNVGDSGMIRLK